jgi:DNA repair exonuclease SbcCD nuclease subunit
VALVTIYTDPHLGLKRKSNFTTASAEARETEALQSLGDLVKNQKAKGHTVVCAGDFFDKSSNTEQVIASTFEIAKHTDHILAGNHDVSNNIESVSSLALLDEIYHNVLFSNEQLYIIKDLGDAELFFIPHVMSQETFLSALERVEKARKKNAVLILHCNYDVPSDTADVHLTLSRERARELLATFHYIFIGHEHTAKEDFGGRLQIIGSFRPTAFDNLDTKSVIVLDTEAMTISREEVWKETNAFVGPASQAYFNLKKQYYDLDDDQDLGKTQSTAVYMLKSGAFGVRVKSKATGVAESISFSSIEFLPDVVLKDLEENEPDLTPLYNKLVEQYMSKL